MATSRSNKSKSTGLRILWIPGGRKSHPKGRFDSTSKQITQLNRQRKNEVWSLGGNKSQQNFIKAEPQTALLDGPSVSSLRPLTCTVGAVGVPQCATVVELPEPKPKADTSATDPNTSTPLTPDSTTSTAPLVSVPNSPEPTNHTSSTADSMPTKTATPVIITTTTTAELNESNRFAILSKDIPGDFDVHELPLPPKDEQYASNTLLNSSAETAANTGATPSPSNSPRGDNDAANADVATTPSKKKLQQRNHNNNHQGDVNSIESISDPNAKIPSLELEWMDDLFLARQSDLLQKSKKKKKKKHSTAKEDDQPDGVPTKANNTQSPADDDEDEKVVKCLYYTLMCCDCTIS